jgi:integrase
VTQHRPLSALDDLPRRLDTRLVFPAEGGGHLDLDNWSRREWKPAIEAAGIEKRGIYELRHTGITNWFAAGLSVFEVSRYAGTSLAMISAVYGHLALGHEANARARRDAFAHECAVIVPQDAGAPE